MPFHERNGLRHFSFEIFPASVSHGIFTRHGGVSPAPWASLNVGGMVGDDPANVRENRERSFAALRRPPASNFDAWLVHSADVLYADAPRSPDQPPAKADIILTDKPDVTLFMRFADCVPILFHDPARLVVGIAHAGWLGTVRGVAMAAVRAMQARYGSRPADIFAAIGPSIGPDHYEIGGDVIEQIERAFNGDAASVLQSRAGGVYLDLWKANQIQLQQMGLRQIEVAGICTACCLEDWYSHRAEKAETGRFGGLIFLTT